ncbi:unnamed protein product, partial [Allacma fusca]
MEKQDDISEEIQNCNFPASLGSYKDSRSNIANMYNVKKFKSRHQHHCDIIIIYPNNIYTTLHFLTPQTFKNMHVITKNNYHWEANTEFRPNIDNFQINNVYVFVRNFDVKDILKESSIINTNPPDKETFSSDTRTGKRHKITDNRSKRNTDALQGKHFRIGIFDLKPQYFTHGRKTLGTAYNIVYYASIKYNFTFEISIAGTSVIKLDDGTFSGFEFDLVYNRSDMLFLYTASFLQHEKVDSTSYFSTASIIFLTSLPTVDTDWRAIIYPLKGSTWAAILGCALAVCCVLSLKLALASIRMHCMNSMSISLNIVFRSLLGQSTTLPKGVKGLALIWIMSCFIFVNYYTSNLLSYLTYPAAENIPQDFSGLAQRSDYRINAIDLPGGPMEQFFSKTTNVEMANIRNRYILYPNWLQCVLDGVTKNKQVCVGWDFIVEGFVHMNATISKLFYPAFKSRSTPITVLTNAILQKNSPYLEGMNEIMCWFRDTGHYFHWRKETEVFIKQVGKSWLQTQQHTQIYKDLHSKFLKLNEINVKAFTMDNLIAPFGGLIYG